MLARQRSRWQRGALEVFFRYRHMLFNPRYGRIGTLGLGHILVVDVVGPIMEVLGYILMTLFWLQGVLAMEYLLAYTALVFLYGVFIRVASLIKEGRATGVLRELRESSVVHEAATIST